MYLIEHFVAFTSVWSCYQHIEHLLHHVAHVTWKSRHIICGIVNRQLVVFLYAGAACFDFPWGGLPRDLVVAYWGQTRKYVPRGGGGGGALGYLGGCIRSLSKLENTPKALISGQQSTLILIKRWFFPLHKHTFYQNTDFEKTGTRILT